MDAESIYAEQIGYNPPGFESCYNLAGKQDAHELGARHAIMLEVRHAFEPEKKLKYLPGANTRGILGLSAKLLAAFSPWQFLPARLH